MRPQDNVGNTHSLYLRDCGTVSKYDVELQSWEHCHANKIQLLQGTENASLVY